MVRLMIGAVLGLLLAASVTGQSAARSCTALSELDCVTSAACTLHKKSGDVSGYECRSASNACERDFVQLSGPPVGGPSLPDRKQTCESRTGCVFDPGECYCPPVKNIDCYCSGGKPPMCRAN